MTGGVSWRMRASIVVFFEGVAVDVGAVRRGVRGGG